MLRALTAGVVAVLLLAACGRDRPAVPPAPAAVSSAAPASLASAPPSTPPTVDWPALREAEQECDGCHPDETSAWRASPMGRSLLAYGGPGAPPAVEAPRGRFPHPLGGQTYEVRLEAGRPVFRDLTTPDAPPRPAAYLIGSGHHTRSYIWTEGDALFEAPLTWYSSRAIWAASPGYESADHPGLFREIKPDCLFCHADPAPHVAGTPNRYTAPAPTAIGCARCHGDARAHAAARLAGRADAPPVVPTKLDPARRADVCDQCHLTGAVRLNREGRAFGQYLPGQALEDTVAIFMRQVPGESFGIASHGERLRRSRCGQGALTCTQCHAPHAPHSQPDRSAACRTCHGETHRACRGGGGPDCAGCHMHRAQTSDIPHVAMTDHFIRVRPEPTGASAVATGPLVWVAHPEPDPKAAAERLLLGRAYAEAARAGGPEADADRRRALALLEDALKSVPESAQGWADLASVRQLSGDRTGMRQSIDRAFSLDPRDVRIVRAAASARLNDGDAAGALVAADAGLVVEPHSVPLLLARANALLIIGRAAEARAALDTAWALRPDAADLWLARGVFAEATGDLAQASAAYEAGAARAPLQIPPRLSLFRVEALQARWPAAGRAVDAAWKALGPLSPAEPSAPTVQTPRGPVPRVLLDRLSAARALVRAHTGDVKGAAGEALPLLQRGAREPWAAQAMGVVAAAAGRPDAALQFLDQAVTWAPEDGTGWAALAGVLRQKGDSAMAERAAAQARRLRASVKP